MGWVLWSNENKKDSIAQVGAKKELSIGMGAVEYPNPIGFELLQWDGCCWVPYPYWVLTLVMGSVLWSHWRPKQDSKLHNRVFNNKVELKWIWWERGSDEGKQWRTPTRIGDLQVKLIITQRNKADLSSKLVCWGRCRQARWACTCYLARPSESQGCSWSCRILQSWLNRQGCGTRKHF
jgi:hypothetical protein